MTLSVEANSLSHRPRQDTGRRGGCCTVNSTSIVYSSFSDEEITRAYEEREEDSSDYYYGSSDDKDYAKDLSLDKLNLIRDLKYTHPTALTTSL